MLCYVMLCYVMLNLPEMNPFISKYPKMHKNTPKFNWTAFEGQLRPKFYSRNVPACGICLWCGYIRFLRSWFVRWRITCMVLQRRRLSWFQVTVDASDPDHHNRNRSLLSKLLKRHSTAELIALTDLLLTPKRGVVFYSQFIYVDRPERLYLLCLRTADGIFIVAIRRLFCIFMETCAPVINRRWQPN